MATLSGAPRKRLGVDMGVEIRPQIENINISIGYWGRLADGVGFEPTERLHVRRFSRPLP